MAHALSRSHLRSSSNSGAYKKPGSPFASVMTWYAHRTFGYQMTRCHQSCTNITQVARPRSFELIIQKILQMTEVEDSCVHSAKYGNRSFAAGLHQSPRTSTSPFVNPQFAKPQHASF